jgi:3-carboxy-cis,cis-muconate cycloisomerase
MRRNLDRTAGLALAGAVADRLAPALGRTAAHDLVREVCAAADGRPLRDALRDAAQVRAQLSEEDIDAALDPPGYLGSAGVFVDSALSAHAETVRLGTP